MTRKLALLAAAALVAGGSAWAQSIDPIANGKAGQDLVAGTFAGIKAVVTAKGDVKTLENPAKALQKWMAVFPTLFPAGSDKGETKAAPAIWTDMAGFQKAAMAMAMAAGKIADAAKAGDEAAVAAAFKETGEACAACHKDYRLK